MDYSPLKIHFQDDRYSRLEAIQWWDQERIKKTHILVVGAGALGNEVLKNMALLGIGNIVVIDMDIIEKSNLSRSVLFRESDENLSKAECAAQMMKVINSECNVSFIIGTLRN